MTASISSVDGQRNPSSSSSSLHPGWTTFEDPPPEPTSTASPELVAKYLHGLEYEMGETLRHSEVARYCQAGGFPIFEVLRTLQRYRAGEGTYSLDDVTYSIDDDAWAALRADHQTACCPIPDWRMGARSGRQRYAFFDCTSLSCPDHSVPRADRLLADARAAFPCYDVLFHTVVVDDPVIIDRVRSRRRRNPCAALQVGTRDGYLHVFATRDLPGTKSPKKFERLMPEEAFERLALAASLPNMVKFHWAGEWAGTATERGLDDGYGEADGAGEEGESEPLLKLPTVQRATREEALRVATECARERWGVTPNEESFPAEVADPKEWAEVLTAATEKVRGLRVWRKAAGL